jgi:fibronectin-binding autotransporter adhesin
MAVWNGTTNSDFLTATNWSGNVVPTGELVIIGSAVPNLPILAEGGSVSVSSLVLQSGTVTIDGTLTVTGGGGVITSDATLNVGASGQLIGDVNWDGTTFNLDGSLVGRLSQSSGTTIIGPTAVFTNQISLNGGTVTVESNTFTHFIASLSLSNSASFVLDGASLSTAALSGSGGAISLTADEGFAKLTFGLAGTDTTYAGTIEAEAQTGIVKEGSGSTEMSGAISGGGDVTVSDGTLILSGTNTYTGVTTVAGGTLVVSGGSAISDTGAVVVANGTMFQVSTEETIGSLASTDTDPENCTAVVQLDADLTIDGSADTTFAGGIAGAGELAIQGGGTLTLNGLNTMTGTLAARAAGSEIVLTGIGSVDSAAVVAEDGGLVSTDGGAFANAAVDLGTATGGTITLGGSEEVGSLLIFPTGTINVNGDTTVLTVNGTNGLTTEIGGTIAGSGTLSLTGGTTGVFDTGDVQTDITLGPDATLVNQGTIANVSTSGTFTSSGDITGNLTVTAGTADIETFGEIVDITDLTLDGGALRLDNAFLSADSLSGTGGTITLTSANGEAALAFGSGGGDTTYAGFIETDVSTGLVKEGAGATTLSGVISGGGTVTVIAGTLTLSGINTYTGDTLVSGGTLVVSGLEAIADTGAVIVANGATFQVADNEAIGSFASEDIDPENCTAVVQNDGGLTILGSTDTTFAGKIDGSEFLTNRGSGTLTLTGVNSMTGSLFSEAAGAEVALTGSGSVASFSVVARDGGLISTDGGAFANAAVDLGTATGGTITLGGSEEVGSLIIEDNSTINVNGGSTVLTVNGTNGLSTDISGTIAGSGTLNLTGGTTTVFAIGNVQTDITLGADATMTNEGTIADISTSGTFTNTSTVTGNIKVAGGTGDINAGSDLAGTATVNVTGGTLNLNIAETIGTLDADGGTVNVNAQLDAGTLSGTAGSIVMDGEAGIVAGAANASSTFGGVLSGGGFLQKLGTGTLTLTGANTFTGGTTVSGGTLALTGSGSLAAGANLTIDPTATVSTDGGALSTTTLLRNDGTLNLTGGGDESIESMFGTGATVLSSGSVLTLNSGTSTISGVVSGAGGLTIAGSATTLSSASTYTGATTVSAASLTISGAGSAASTLVNVTGGTLNIDGDALADGAAVAVNGSGILNLTGSETIASLQGDGTVNLGGTVLGMGAQAGALGAMTFNGGEGADTLAFTLAASLKSFSLAAATFSGWTIGQDTVAVSGNTLNNTISGSTVAESIQGAAGKDKIKAGDGRDIVDGGLGNDKLGGGGAMDTFLFVVGDGEDTITDFDTKGKDADIIDLSDIAAVKNFKDLMKNHVDDAGSNIVIDLGGGQSIKLLGVQEKQLDADMFVI